MQLNKENLSRTICKCGGPKTSRAKTCFQCVDYSWIPKNPNWGKWKRTEAHNKANSERQRGNKLSKEAYEKLLAYHRRKVQEKNPQWKGGTISYRALHKWVERRLGKPTFCVMCKRTEAPVGKGKSRSYFQWANISGKYKMEIQDWKRLCYRCHKIFDKKV